jgi:hypothetical protein
VAFRQLPHGEVQLAQAFALASENVPEGHAEELTQLLLNRYVLPLHEVQFDDEELHVEHRLLQLEHEITPD